MRIVPLFSVLLAVSLLGASAHAQLRGADDPRRIRADALFMEGIVLHNQGMGADALEKFEESYAHYPSPNTLFNIARLEHKSGKHRDAIRHYREAMRSPLLAPRALDLGRRFVAELAPEFARIDLKGPLGLEVTFGGIMLQRLWRLCSGCYLLSAIDTLRFKGKKITNISLCQ